MAAYPPLGTSVEPSAIFSALFFVAGVLCILNGVRLRFKVYMIMGISGLLRGVAFALRASSIAQGSASPATAGVHYLFLNMGYGISVCLASLLLGVWFKNARSKSKPSRPLQWRMACIAWFPIGLIFGPGLSIILVGILFGEGSASAISVVLQLTKAISMVLFINAAVFALTEFGCWLLARSRRDKGRPDPDSLVGVLCVASALQAWAGGFRLHGAYVNPGTAGEEALYYPLQVLPELLHLCLWCWPGLIMRSALGSGLQAWQDQSFGAAPPSESVAKEKAGMEESAIEITVSDSEDALDTDVAAAATAGRGSCPEGHLEKMDSGVRSGAAVLQIEWGHTSQSS